MHEGRKCISGISDLSEAEQSSLSELNALALEFWAVSRQARGFVLHGEKVFTVERALKILQLVSQTENPVTSRALELQHLIIQGKQ